MEHPVSVVSLSSSSPQLIEVVLIFMDLLAAAKMAPVSDGNKKTAPRMDARTVSVAGM